MIDLQSLSPRDVEASGIESHQMEQRGVDVGHVVGVFDSVIGYESVEGPSNPNYTRSYGHSLEPQTHTGIMASYRVNEAISLSAGIANTKGPVINARGFGEDGKAEVECGGIMEFPGYPFCVSATNVN